MTRVIFATAFSLGAAAVVWMASTFLGADILAFAVTAVIGFAYTLGFAELLKYRQATTSLEQALTTLASGNEQEPIELGSWLVQVHPSLHHAVRLRVEGELYGLPAPVITPYIVGLLVMLGLLGTFVGMVVTLQGAVLALEGSTELQAIRAGLAAPINGLSLAFGTSVAGVAASAMLGLASTLSRRDRLLATRELDHQAAIVFADLSLAHNRRETYKVLQMQAQALPQVAERLALLAERLESMSTSLGDNLLAGHTALGESLKTTYNDLTGSVDESLKRSLTESASLGDKLLAAQATLGDSLKSTYSDLAHSVDKSLKLSLSESGRLAGDSFKPLLQQAMSTITEEARQTHNQLSSVASEQLHKMTEHFEQASLAVSSAWQQSDEERMTRWEASFSNAQAQSTAQLAEAASGYAVEIGHLGEAQLAAFGTATTTFEFLSGSLTDNWTDAGQRMTDFAVTVTAELSGLRAQEEERSRNTDERLAKLEASATEHLAALARNLEEPMTRLINTASETPRAAAEVIGQLKNEISNNMERDNQLLLERQEVMTQLHTLSESLAESSAAQREAAQALVNESAETLASMTEQFNARIERDIERMSSLADHLTGSSADMGSLTEAFSVAVTQFGESNNALIAQLARIEVAMDNSTSRSDEQMAYYVAQAREIIDQSLLSQKEVFDELHQLSQHNATGAEVG